MPKNVLPTALLWNTHKLAADTKRKTGMSIRTDILLKSPFFDRVAAKLADPDNDPETFAHAIEGHLRGISNLPALDGFESFHVLEETLTSLRVVGLVYRLPSGVLPIEAVFRAENDDISYRILLGVEDLAWKNLSEKKRWAAVYLYATETRQLQWHWQPPVEGLLSA